MDNVTHALAGALLAESVSALRSARSGADASPAVRRALFGAGIVAAELPDVDLVYAGPVLGMGPLGYLLHHRGHTHTIVVALLGALVVWGLVLACSRAARARDLRGWLLALCVAGTLSHLALDWTNSYGVHPFWPVDSRWRYGDAVFIVEPWLWIASIPPLLWLARGRGWRALLLLLFGAIVAAAWATGMVPREAAVAVTVGAALWLALTRRAAAPRVALYGACAWLAAEAAFLATARVARAEVRRAASAGFVDAVLSPAPGDPTCISGLVIEDDGVTYRVSRTSVALWPRAGRTACGRPRVGMPAAWSAPHAELVSLARTRCDVAAALQFIRVPMWERRPDGSVALWDARFGRGGFATIVSPAVVTTCPAHVPGWVAPRADLLDTSR